MLKVRKYWEQSSVLRMNSRIFLPCNFHYWIFNIIIIIDKFGIVLFLFNLERESNNRNSSPCSRCIRLMILETLNGWMRFSTMVLSIFKYYVPLQVLKAFRTQVQVSPFLELTPSLYSSVQYSILQLHHSVVTVTVIISNPI